MDKHELSFYFAQCDELNRLSRIINREKETVLQRFPEVLKMRSFIGEDQAHGSIVIEVSGISSGLISELQDHFGNESVTIRETDFEESVHFLHRRLFEKDLSATLDQIGYREGLFMQIAQDEDGPFIDMRLGNNTAHVRQFLEAEYPNIRFKFSDNDKSLTLGFTP